MILLAALLVLSFLAVAGSSCCSCAATASGTSLPRAATPPTSLPPADLPSTDGAGTDTAQDAFEPGHRER